MECSLDLNIYLQTCTLEKISFALDKSLVIASLVHACMHAWEQKYGKSTSTLVALGAVPCSAVSVSRLLFRTQQYTDIVYYSIVYIYTDIVSCKHYGIVYTNIAYTISMW